MNKWIVSLAAVPLACISGVVMGDPVTYEFTVTAINGPLTGDVSDGSFTFNSSIVPTGGGTLAATGLLSALSFTWNGITYNSLTANTGFLGFNGNGTLTSVLFGNFCNAGSCGSSGNSETWFIEGTEAGSGFAYGVPSSPFGYNGTVSFSGALPPPFVPVPEPSTLSLLGFGLGLAGMGLMRRSKNTLIVTRGASGH